MNKCWIKAIRKTQDPRTQIGFSSFIDSIKPMKRCYAEIELSDHMGICSECGAEQLLSYTTCNYNGICQGKVIPIPKVTDGKITILKIV